MTMLSQSRYLQAAADHFREKHKKAIADEQQEETAQKIARVLPQMLATGLMVWCRNGSVSPYAVPCRALACSYKEDLSEVILGCAKCHQFQVTTHSAYWDNAEHRDWRTWSPDAGTQGES